MIQPAFKIGDKVRAIALPDAFPAPRPEVRGLVVTRITQDGGITMPVYYRVLAEATDRLQETTLVEGAERFFELEQ